MMVNDRLLGQQMDEAEARWFIWVEAHVDVIGPGGELGKDARGAGVAYAIADILHVLVYMAIEDAAQPVPGRPQRLVQNFTV